jgi:hypothetical protein
MKKPINGASSNCTNPLKLSWNETVFQYKVNKPQDQSGLYVSKHIADALLKELVEAKARILGENHTANVSSINEAIEAATSK